ncbi:MAG TPA: TlpA disulfide reductase family protein [Gaiellaceae bacterium]|nr:TlpA disulfide reductase family protein [Gaiellaceae bacterium]
MRVIWFATGGLAVIVAIVVGVLLATRSTPAVAPPAQAIASDRDAPASLVQAANQVGFHPTTEAGVGQVEGKPATDAHPPSNPNLLAVGSVAPAFTLKTPQGQTVSLSQYRGKAVLLEFFATWCPHCNAEAPHLRTLYASLSKGQYAFVAVNADGETAPSVFAFHRYYGLQYPALVDPGSTPGSFNNQGSPGPVTTKYQVEAFPTFYVIDPLGQIAWRGDGEQPDALLRQQLRLAAARD